MFGPASGSSGAAHSCPAGTGSNKSIDPNACHRKGTGGDGLLARSSVFDWSMLGYMTTLSYLLFLGPEHGRCTRCSGRAGPPALACCRSYASTEHRGGSLERADWVCMVSGRSDPDPD